MYITRRHLINQRENPANNPNRKTYQPIPLLIRGNSHETLSLRKKSFLAFLCKCVRNLFYLKVILWRLKFHNFYLLEPTQQNLSKAVNFRDFCWLKKHVFVSSTCMEERGMGRRGDGDGASVNLKCKRWKQVIHFCWLKIGYFHY